MKSTSASESHPRIFALPENVRNQIAAGEVVERPASVVKELVENALDSGATEIKVELEEGGVKLVRVTDNGCGMSEADLSLAFTPHATSKLREVDDLEHIASLGFRGEALASIGSVARARIQSRLAGGATTGHAIENEGGRIGAVLEAGGPAGTIVEVRDLFYNTPARRRFLKRTATELGRCLDVLQRLVLAHPGVGFVVTHDKKRVLDVEASMDLRGRVRRLFGSDLAEALVALHERDGDTEITGLIAPPRFARRDTSRQVWFLNGRPLRDKLLVRCLRQAYSGYQVENRQPVAFVSISMNPEKVDVNVHPQKTEVRFREERRLFGFLHNALRRAVAKTDMATPGGRMLDAAARRDGTDLQPARQQVFRDDSHERPGARDGSDGSEELRVFEVPGQPFDPSSIRATAGAPRAEGDTPAAADAPAEAWDAPDDLRGPYLKIAKTYVVRALSDGFEIVDQHALHERVTFERLKAQLDEGGIEVQRLLVPELVELSRAEVQLLSDRLEALRGIGFELDVFGETTIAVHGLPALLRRPKPTELVRELLATFEARRVAPSPGELLGDVLHSMACRSSVMAGDDLDELEIRALLEEAARVDAQTCPHGRPVRVRFSLYDLERAFHRR